jgi:hypothetical protein
VRTQSRLNLAQCARWERTGLAEKENHFVVEVRPPSIPFRRKNMKREREQAEAQRYHDQGIGNVFRRCGQETEPQNRTDEQA